MDNSQTFYSEVEIEAQNIKVAGAEEYVDMSCINTCKQAKTLKHRTKVCRGIERKSKPKVTAMELEEAVHIPRKILEDISGLKSDKLKEGVCGTSIKAKFKEFSLTQLVLDEDDNELLKAYPRCILADAPEINIDNSSDEVVAATLKIKVMPDENGFFEYEAVKTVVEETIAQTWMTGFDPGMVIIEEI